VVELKFNLDQSISFEGKMAVIWDYSIRYNEYDVKFEDGTIIHGISEGGIQECLLDML
jgi:hypothetical protein